MRELFSKAGVKYGLVALVTAVMMIPIGAIAGDDFNDVPNDNPFHNDIAWMLDNGVTSGCGNGNYCPSENVTREQMAAFMQRLATKKVVNAATAETAVHATTADSATSAATAANAGDSDQLAGNDPLFYQSAAYSDGFDYMATATVALSSTPAVLAELTLSAPGDGIAILGASTSVRIFNASEFAAMWVEIDDGTCSTFSNGFVTATSSVPGSSAFAQPVDGPEDVSLGSSSGTAITGGDHLVTLCGAVTAGSGTAWFAGLTAIWMPDGTATTSAAPTGGSPTPAND